MRWIRTSKLSHCKAKKSTVQMAKRAAVDGGAPWRSRSMMFARIKDRKLATKKYAIGAMTMSKSLSASGTPLIRKIAQPYKPNSEGDQCESSYQLTVLVRRGRFCRLRSSSACFSSLRASSYCFFRNSCSCCAFCRLISSSCCRCLRPSPAFDWMCLISNHRMGPPMRKVNRIVIGSPDCSNFHTAFKTSNKARQSVDESDINVPRAWTVCQTNVSSITVFEKGKIAKQQPITKSFKNKIHKPHHTSSNKRISNSIPFCTQNFSAASEMAWFACTARSPQF